MKKIFRYFLLFILTLIIISLTWAAFNFSLVKYGFNQLKGQLNIVMNARPLNEVLQDETVSDSIKKKIYYIERVKKFAQDSLGLNSSENYTTFYNQHNKPILWVLTASELFKLKPYEWKFPFLGNVSYKGFFEYEKGKTEEIALQKEGYDTDYGEVTAWSTLGWFHDPILSSMTNRSNGQLAELIIHELTHATLYIKSNVNFNENLATVCGEQGAIRFLQSAYGPESNELKDYLERKEDYNLFSRQMLKGTQMLDSLYLLMNDSSVLQKKSLKKSMIKTIVHSLDTISFHSPFRFKNIFKNKFPNNAYFLDFIRYDAQKDEMKKSLTGKFNGNIKDYIEFLKLRKDSI